MPLYRCVICTLECRYDRRLPALYPFCSQRCRLVDLGRWLNESYSIDREITPEEAAALRETGAADREPGEARP